MAKDLQKKAMGKPVPRPERTLAVQAFVPEIAKGLTLTAKHFFRNTRAMVLGERPDPALESLDERPTTISYPEQRCPYPERMRGVHRLTHREDGTPRCVACLCCSTACPAQCIHIVAAEYSEMDERRGRERYPRVFVIDELRCIFCGFCVEACPCDAIRMDTGRHAAPYDSRVQFIYKQELLMAMPGRDKTHATSNTRHEPGDPTYPGIDRDRPGH